MVAELRSQLANRERELHRLKDLIFKQQFGVQLYDTLPVETMPEPEPETPKSADEQMADSLEEADRRAKNRLASLFRTSPSKLGPAIAEEMRARMARQASAARPMVPEVQQIFAKAKEEAN